MSAPKRKNLFIFQKQAIVTRSLEGSCLRYAYEISKTRALVALQRPAAVKALRLNDVHHQSPIMIGAGPLNGGQIVFHHIKRSLFSIIAGSDPVPGFALTHRYLASDLIGNSGAFMTGTRNNEPHQMHIRYAEMRLIEWSVLEICYFSITRR